MIRTTSFRCILAILLLVPGLALAQAFPSRPLRVVVPFAPGGAVDTVARIVGGRVSEQVKQPVVVENRPGAHANLGAELVAKSAPDGYTLLLGANGLAANGSLYRDLAYDTLRDFAAVARVGYAPLVLVVPESAAAPRSLRDLVESGRKDAARLTYGSAGAGSSGHLATELFKSTGGFEALHVPYKGGAPALTDLVGVRLSFMLINPLEASPHVRAKRLRPLAVSNDRRLPLFPDAPTFAEAGLPAFQASVWWGFVVPARTPREAVQKLGEEVQRALQDATVREKLEALGAVVAPQGPEAFHAFLAQEIRTWAGVIQKSGIKAE